MINGYTLTVALHVVIAVIGIGQIAAILTVVSFPGDPAAALAVSRKLAIRVSGSLVAMLLTGIGAEALIHFADEPKIWFRGGFLLLLLIGAGAGYISSVARKAKDNLPQALEKVQLAAGITSVLVAVAAVLMSLKP